MLIVLMIICVLIGLAYADYCLVDNTAHFGITFARIAEAEESFAVRLARVVSVEREVDEEGESEFTVPPAVDSPGIATRATERSGTRSPQRRPGSGKRIAGTYPAQPSVDAGVAVIGS